MEKRRFEEVKGAPAVGRAFFKQEELADRFADECRAAGFYAGVAPQWSNTNIPKKGWMVKWWKAHNKMLPR